MLSEVRGKCWSYVEEEQVSVNAEAMQKRSRWAWCRFVDYPFLFLSTHKFLHSSVVSIYPTISDETACCNFVRKNNQQTNKRESATPIFCIPWYIYSRYMNRLRIGRSMKRFMAAGCVITLLNSWFWAEREIPASLDLQVRQLNIGKEIVFMLSYCYF
jgi:hypothetical protein